MSSQFHMTLSLSETSIFSLVSKKMRQVDAAIALLDISVCFEYQVTSLAAFCAS
jgi:hypothetical protein